MKMDFPHVSDTDPAERQRARYAALVACAANGQLQHIYNGAGWQGSPLVPDQFDGLDARIGYFGAKPGRGKNLIFGAFLPKVANSAVVDGEAENDVNLAASMNSKPNFLGSHYPGHPVSLRGMEN